MSHLDGDRRIARFPWGRAFLVTAGGIALIALVSISGVAAVTRHNNPELALRFAPHDAVANWTVADRLQQQVQSPADNGDAVVRYAQAALARSPLSPAAARILGFVAEGRGDVRRSRAFLAESDKLSRRDLGTRLWLINDAAARGDTVGTLKQYDIAMRSSPVARSILFPQLTQAITDKEFVEPVVKLLRTNPNWSGEFVVSALTSGVATANLAEIAARSPNIVQGNPPVRQALMDALVQEGRFDAAYRFYSAYSDPKPVFGVVDPSFRADSSFPPFGWRYEGAADFGADSSPDGLSFSAKNSAGGAVAHQLLLLAAGRYRVTTTGFARSEDGDGTARWVVSCANRGGAELGRLSLPTERAFRQGAFSVPAACPAVWLKLVVAAGTSLGGLEGAVREVRIVQSGR